MSVVKDFIYLEDSWLISISLLCDGKLMGYWQYSDKVYAEKAYRHLLNQYGIKEYSAN